MRARGGGIDLEARIISKKVNQIKNTRPVYATAAAARSSKSARANVGLARTGQGKGLLARCGPKVARVQRTYARKSQHLLKSRVHVAVRMIICERARHNNFLI